ncbi:baseplate assembly protein [Aquipseudomonas alcaligenes]|uniref:Baseplate assembly protein n=1 Tax=Aquipseudomonas alcaligenes TaxID=43263 RepID=A0AA37CDB2_AQUAC|nr:baseplate J/gp47 family protein [Pseudomonas alcaligenes]BCR26627.1 baseplate assembly protein [Pseudomonas alcaligenes]GIZ65777.1 baseplate assembly protein [Pseudomonas alcaligenes]GIZ70111.1 baseplate assembly protein [Pseudomonas alcaligenes]GIZ74464.1 baseplate assembly protein [Pseudomonas alcaligenes]GIZ78792.1 baseplate assembly protein [Pseudomonas alcaligenes]
MSQFTAINLALVAAPKVVEELDFEQVYGEMLADLLTRMPEFDALLESEPVIKILQVAAYRETVLRQRVNDAARAVMLPYSTGNDLDNLGALFGVQRLMLSPAVPAAIPPIAAVYEGDNDFRYRIQLSLEGLSTAGPEGAYIYHALSADGQVLDASATSPTPGQVVITVLSRQGSGVPSAQLLATVLAKLSDESVRPLTDFIQVQAATVVPYQVTATLYFYAGPDREVIMANARAALQAYTDAQHRLGLDVTLSGIYAALHQPGVQRVDLTSPTANLVLNRQSASYCTAINLTDGGLDE